MTAEDRLRGCLITGTRPDAIADAAGDWRGESGHEIVAVRLTQAADADGLALALPEEVAMARPVGVRRGMATYRLPIEGRDGWLAAAGLGGAGGS